MPLTTRNPLPIGLDKIDVPKRRRPASSTTGLAASIRELGLLHPITVVQSASAPRWTLVAGLHRLGACRSLGWTTIPAVVLSPDQARVQLAELDENLARIELTELERAEQTQRRKEVYEALHPEARRGASGGAATQRKHRGLTATLSVSPAPAAAAIAAGRSERTIRRESQIATRIPEEVRDQLRDTPVADRKTDLVQLARMPEPQQRAVAERITQGQAETVPDAVRAMRREERIERLAQVSTGNAPLPKNRQWSLILADPPWRYDQLKGDRRGVEQQYPTMDIEQICAMDVPGLTTPAAAVLFLWATSPLLPEALRVIAAWGFSFKSSMVWVKHRQGLGHYVRVRHELLLIATRGAMPTPRESDRPDSVIEAPAGKHSEKPAAAYERIERMYPELAKLELFARAPRAGWDAWGNEVPC